jgi:hypothetical protein
MATSGPSWRWAYTDARQSPPIVSRISRTWAATGVVQVLAVGVCHLTPRDRAEMAISARQAWNSAREVGGNTEEKRIVRAFRMTGEARRRQIVGAQLPVGTRI